MLATSAPNPRCSRKALYDAQRSTSPRKRRCPSIYFRSTRRVRPIAGLALPPRKQRKVGATQIQQHAAAKSRRHRRHEIVVFQPPSLPGAFGLPIQFAIKTTEPASRLNEVSTAFLAEALKSGEFMFFDTDLKFDLPQSVIEIDRDKTAQLGLTMSQVGTALGGLLGGGYVNYFSMDTRSYKVIPQVERVSRLNVEQLLNYPVATIGGVPVPLSTIAKIRSETVPETLNHFQQLNSATLSGVMSAGVSLDDALKYLQGLAARTLPRDIPSTTAAKPGSMCRNPAAS